MLSVRKVLVKKPRLNAPMPRPRSTHSPVGGMALLPRHAERVEVCRGRRTLLRRVYSFSQREPLQESVGSPISAWRHRESCATI